MASPGSCMSKARDPAVTPVNCIFEEVALVRCEVVAVGTELLLGIITDTNSSWIGEQLALSGIDGAPGGRDTVLRRYDVESATALLAKAGLTVEEVHGVRVVADLVPGGVAEREHDGLVAFELAAAGRSPYRDIATQVHLLARRA